MHYTVNKSTEFKGEYAKATFSGIHRHLPQYIHNFWVLQQPPEFVLIDSSLLTPSQKHQTIDPLPIRLKNEENGFAILSILAIQSKSDIQLSSNAPIKK
ncbi:hypothetical protein VNO77_44469 [Canavalia gladiata]|uniref:Uncharacterized protein n=1 Tax=Canavalia gladiata TaxID=3824 RepID=A0AAN9JWS2_CANGL